MCNNNTYTSSVTYYNRYFLLAEWAYVTLTRVLRVSSNRLMARWKKLLGASAEYWIEADYLASAWFGNLIEPHTRIERIMRVSFSFTHIMKWDDRVIIRPKVSVTYMRWENSRPIRRPTALWNRLRPYIN